jgi:antitoxin HicB
MTATIAGYPCHVRPLTADEGGGYLITFPDLPGCMADGETLPQARKEAADAVRGYLASCRAHGDTVPTPGSGGPASGKFLVRLPKSLHAALVERARVEGVSMNQYLTALVAAGIERPRASRRRMPARGIGRAKPRRSLQPA